MKRLSDIKNQKEINLEFMEKEHGKHCIKFCKKHGDHDAYGDDESIMWCAGCRDDREREKNRIHEEKRQALINAGRWLKCGMPKKFCGITLNDWVVQSREQQEAKDAAVAFINGEFKRALFTGSCGTGKTMLAAGIIGEMSKRKPDSFAGKLKPIGHKDPNDKIVYSTATRLIRSIRETWKNGTSEQKAMDEYINTSVLVVDELGAGRCTEDDKLILSEILCDRYALDLPTLLISNLSGNDIKEKALDERAVDRMREGGKIIDMAWKSHRVMQ
jgi:DNA replication protein DnaC